MSYWFYLNLATLLYAVIYFIYSLPKTGVGLLSSLFGLLGLLFILFNWNMHAIFSRIRTLKSRQRRIRIAKYARKIMPFHIYIGILGLLMIVGHLFTTIYLYGLSLHSQSISGYVAFGGLIAVTVSGWLRKTRASRFQRLFHLYSSLVLFFLILLHLFV